MKNNGMDLATGLTLLFVALKLTNVIAWPWWLVFMPIIAGVGLFLLIVMFGSFIAAFIYRIRNRDKSDVFPDLEDSK